MNQKILKEATLHLPKIEVSYGTDKLQVEKKTISNSYDCYNVLNTLFDHKTIELFEEFNVLYLDMANQII